MALFLLSDLVNSSMLKKTQRISRKSFNEAFARSKVISRGSFFMVKKLENQGFQASVVVSKKVAKKATERNYIKRVIYTLFQDYLKTHPDYTGTYILIVQKKPLEYKELLADFNTQFK